MGRTMRILVVDDEQSVLELLALICAREGHEVATAASSTDALAQIKTGLFDLLITDIVMPGMDGLELVRRSKTLHADLMAIVITGHAGQYTLADVLAAGATDLMLKPFRAPELRARLKLAMEQRHAIDSWRERRREAQRAGAEMIAGLQRELEDARHQVARLSARLSPTD